MRILITGSRTWTDREITGRALQDAAKTASMYPGPVIVIQGGALGADLLAASAALTRGWLVATIRANREFYGKAAGHIRNTGMTWLMQPPAPGDICLAFICPCIKEDCPDPQPHDSHGVTSCIRAARKAGMEVKEYR